MEFTYRKATLKDVNALENLIQESSVSINAAYYTKDEIDAALGSAWAVDYQLIEDNSYWIVENSEKKAVGCGGWSDRKLFYGRHENEEELSEKLVPGIDSARIRAFFVHQDYVRKGIGKTLVQKCEEEAQESGFDSCELVATLSGEKLYAKMGYMVLKRHEIDLENGITNKVVSMFKMLGGNEQLVAQKRKRVIHRILVLAAVLFILYKIGVMDRIL